MVTRADDIRDRSPIRTLPDALRRFPEIRARLRDCPIAVFVDLDGTLAPIADDPDAVVLPPGTREAVRSLARRCPVAILSGRGLEDLVDRVGLEGLHYAGCHGLELRGPGGLREQRGQDHLRLLDAAEWELRDTLGESPRVRIERKRFGVAVHTRRASQERSREVAETVSRVAAHQPRLEVHEGKRVFELRPAIDWDKGRALERLLEHFGNGGREACPVYVGDDVTDEDAFDVLQGEEGIPVVVRGEDDGRLTRAEYSLESPAEVRRFLQLLVELLEDRDG